MTNGLSIAARAGNKRNGTAKAAATTSQCGALRRLLLLDHVTLMCTSFLIEMTFYIQKQKVLVEWLKV